MTVPELRSDRRGPVASLWARWWLAVILIAIGGVAGGLVGHSKPVNYTSESRLVVGSEDLSSYEVAGFALASQQLASNYARYVDNSSIVSTDLVHSLKSHVKDLVSISASPIPGSAVISVEVVATSRATAKVGAQTIAETLLRLTKSANVSTAPPLLVAYKKLSRRAQLAANNVGRLNLALTAAKQANKPFASLQSRLVTAQTAASSLRLQTNVAANRYQAAVVNPPSDSALNLVQRAAIIDDNSKKTIEIYTVAGAIVGVLLALALASLLERRAGRRRTRRAAATFDAAFDVQRDSVALRPPVESFDAPFDAQGDSVSAPPSVQSDRTVGVHNGAAHDPYARHFESSAEPMPAESGVPEQTAGVGRSERRYRRRGRQ